ncbi:MAG TPA: NUDIX domain-containing protein [Bacteroidota bacterium]|nr:NUDIX domain-containing protein [Bacteroidota bacterium]
MAKVVSEVVEVCVFRRTTSNAEYLLLQRSSNEDLYPNMWQIVTGTLQQGETALQGAMREFVEETNLPLRRLWNVPYVSSFYIAANDTVQLSPFFAAEVNVDCEVEISHEHQKFEWLPFHEARERLVWPAQRRGLEIVQEYIVSHNEVSLVTEILQPQRKD